MERILDMNTTRRLSEHTEMTTDTQTNEVARLQQQIRNMLEIIDDDTKQKTELHNEVARLRKLMRDYIDFIDENMGTTADWPMEAAFDDETTAQRHCDLLNAMKREVKPEDIN